VRQSKCGHCAHGKCGCRSSGLKGYGELGLTCSGLLCGDGLGGRSFVSPCTSNATSSFLPYLHARSSPPPPTFFKGKSNNWRYCRVLSPGEWTGIIVRLLWQLHDDSCRHFLAVLLKPGTHWRRSWIQHGRLLRLYRSEDMAHFVCLC